MSTSFADWVERLVGHRRRTVSSNAKHRRPVTFPLNPSGSGAVTTQKKERA